MSSLFFSSPARRALLGFSGLSSPIVSKCSVISLIRLSPSSFIPFNTPWLAASTTTTTPGRRFFSSSVEVRASADEHMKCVLQAQITRAQEEADREFFVPKDFPFEVVDNSGEQMITLKRNDFDRNLEVKVDCPDWSDNEVQEDIKAGENLFRLTVKIDKGENTYLEFDGYLDSKEFIIQEMHLKYHKVSDDTEKYEGPSFGELEGALYMAAVKYLQARGIGSFLWEFLNEYMAIKKGREHLDWLKNIKDFFTM